MTPSTLSYRCKAGCTKHTHTHTHKFPTYSRFLLLFSATNAITCFQAMSLARRHQSVYLYGCIFVCVRVHVRVRVCVCVLVFHSIDTPINWYIIISIPRVCLHHADTLFIIYYHLLLLLLQWDESVSGSMNKAGFIAQGLEHWSCKPGVVSSNLTGA